MKKFFLIALIALLCSMGFARGTWSIMNADPNGIIGFEDNMNSSFMKVKMPSHLRTQAIEKWQNKEYEVVSFPYGYHVKGMMISGGLIQGTQPYTWDGNFDIKISKVWRPSDAVRNELANFKTGQKISRTRYKSNGGRYVIVGTDYKVYAKQVQVKWHYEDMTSDARVRWGTSSDEDCLFKISICGDGYYGQYQCGNFLFEQVNVEKEVDFVPTTGIFVPEPPPPTPPVVIIPPKPVSPIVIVPPTPKPADPIVIVPSAPKPEPYKKWFTPKLEYWGWVSHSQDHFLESSPDSLYNPETGTNITIIQRSSNPIFGNIPWTLIGGGGVRFRPSDSFGLAAEVYAEDQEDILASKLNFQVEKYFGSLKSETRLFMGPEWRNRQYPYWKRTVLTYGADTETEVSVIRYDLSPLTTVESGLQGGLHHFWDREKYNFASLYLAQMFREEDEKFKSGSREIKAQVKWEDDFLVRNSYIRGEVSHFSFPKSLENNGLYVPTQDKTVVEFQAGARLSDNSPMRLTLGIRDIRINNGRVKTEIQDSDGNKYKRFDVFAALHINPFLNSRRLWFEARISHSSTEQKYDTYTFLNTEDKHFLGFIMKFGFYVSK